MTVPYFARLLCLCLAAFFLVHLLLTLAVAAISSHAVRRAEGMRPRSGARLLFGLRLLPLAVAGLVVGGVCAPSYLWLEPDIVYEQIGITCLAAAVLGAWICAAAGARSLHAWFRSRRFVRVCESAAGSDTPMLLLAGVFRPRLVVSRATRRALTADQLSVALRHERAHGKEKDNLKRLLILLAPDALPFVRSLTVLNRGWSRMAEWAADDQAVSGSLCRSLALAAALVRMARLGAASGQAGLATPLLGDPDDLAARVERLLEPNPATPVSGRIWPGLALAACGAVVAFHPSALVLAHEALEALAH